MKKTACQPTGEGLAQTPLPIQDRPSSVYHGTEKIQKWVRRGNLWIGGLIMTCAMILSYSHTANLFRWAFYDGWLAHVGVIMVELTFFLGAMNIILAKSAGLLAGWPARVAFIFGALLVGWSNVSSGKMFLSREETAIALGLAIPICLFLMEAIVSRALFLFRTVGQTDVRQTDHADNQTGILNERTTDNRTDILDSQMAEQSRIPDSQTEMTRVLKTGHTKKTTKQISQTDTPKEEQSTRQSNGNRTAPEPDSSDNKAVAKQKVSEPRTVTGQSDIHKIIQQIIESEGKPPSIRQLAIQADVSKYKAEKALKEWREKKRVS